MLLAAFIGQFFISCNSSMKVIPYLCIRVEVLKLMFWNIVKWTDIA